MPLSTQRRNVSTLSAGHAPSQGIEPFSSAVVGFLEEIELLGPRTSEGGAQDEHPPARHQMRQLVR